MNEVTDMWVRRLPIGDYGEVWAKVKQHQSGQAIGATFLGLKSIENMVVIPISLPLTKIGVFATKEISSGGDYVTIWLWSAYKVESVENVDIEINALGHLENSSEFPLPPSTPEPKKIPEEIVTLSKIIWGLEGSPTFHHTDFDYGEDRLDNIIEKMKKRSINWRK